MENLKTQLEQQFLYNKRKNLFCDEPISAFGFSPVLVAYIKQNLSGLRLMRATEEAGLVTLLVDKAIASLCRANQFYHFNSFDRTALEGLYKRLLHQVKALHGPVRDEELASLAQQHYRALQRWLKQSNPFARLLYDKSEPYIAQEVVCGEYSAEAQLELLNMDLHALQEPVLDLGCGSQAFLVRYLRACGIEAYGIDRNVVPTEYLFQSDWFEFDLASREWGTILSNLGFSNHFQHHHLRADGNYALYAQRFMEILRSLKRGGAFYYAPDLPFIEQYLEASRFAVHKVEVAGTPYCAARIVKH